MKRTLIVVVSYSTLISGIIALVSLWPGRVLTILSPFGFILLLILVVSTGPWLFFASMTRLIRWVRTSKESPWKMLGSLVIHLAGVSLITAVLLLAVNGVFLEIAFRRQLPEFEVAASRIDTSKPVNRQFGRRVGMWTVDRYGVDEQGGIYFRIDTAMAMIDMWSFGFAFKPGKRGTPFGKARYTLRPLKDGWYYFKVNDDF